MKEKIEQKPEIIEFIKQESFLKEHFKSPGGELDRIITCAIVFFPADNCDISAEIRNHSGHFQYTLIVADTVCYAEDHSGLMNLFLHRLKVVKTTKRQTVDNQDKRQK